MERAFFTFEFLLCSVKLKSYKCPAKRNEQDDTTEI